MQDQSLDGEDSLEECMVSRSSILAGKIPWTEEPGGWATAHGVAKSWTLKQLGMSMLWVSTHDNT